MEMMKGEQSNVRIEDLSIGDWFQARMVKWDYDDLDITPPMRVVKIEKDCVRLGFSLDDLEFDVFVDDLQPIPITSEVLEKNGFEKLWLSERRWENEEMCIAAVRDTECKYWVVCEADYNHIAPFDVNVYSVHEFQHALRLACVGKEIVL